ncbi:MAG: glycosyl hydrolase family 17 protein [Spirochaetaceae bacterium]
MSSKGHRVMTLAGVNYNNHDTKDLTSQFSELLNSCVHGMCFSPYTQDQKPGDIITEEQIRAKIEIIKPYTNWIRIFSTTDGNENIPRIAHEYGLKTMVGAWIGKDLEVNEKEISNVIEIAKSGYADIVAVGNEVMLREDITEEKLIEYISKVKKEIIDIPVGYVDAYYIFEERPKITEVCDVILANCYPFWEGCSLEHSVLYMKDMYRRATIAAKSKKVIISETGWPNIGTKFFGAIPSKENAIKYFINTYNWAKEEDLEIFYFSTFDEAWKVEDEGDVGAYWGIWDKNGKLKY